MAARGDIRAGRAFVELYVRDNRLATGLKKAGQALQSFGLASVAAGTAILTPLAAAAKRFADVGDELDKMSLRTGASVEALSELGFAAEQSGANLGAVENGIRRMQRTIGDAADGTQMAVDSLEKLGLTADDLQGMAVEDQFTLIADRLSQIADPTLRAAAAMEVFGRSGTQLLPLLADGADGINALRQEARDLGLSLSGEQAKSAAALTDALNRMKRSVDATVVAIGGALAPAFTDALAIIQPLLTTVRDWVAANGRLVVGIAAIGAALVAGGTAVAAFGFVLTGIGSALSVVLGLLGAILSPIGLITTALVAGAAAWMRYTESGQAFVRGVGEFFGPILQTAQDTIRGITDALMAGDIALAGQVAFQGLQVAAMQGLLSLSNLVGGTMGDLAASIGGALLQGDVQQAWTTALQALHAAVQEFAARQVRQWADLATYTVELMRKAFVSVLELYRSTVRQISGGLSGIAAAAGVGSAAGRAALGAGAGLTTGVNIAADSLTSDANAMADDFAASMDRWATTAEEASERVSGALAKSVAGARPELADALRQAQEELARLTAEAQTRAQQARAAAGGDAADAMGGMSSSSVFGSFSAAALAAAGQARGPQERMAKDIAETKEIQKKQLEADMDLLDELKKTGLAAFQ